MSSLNCSTEVVISLTATLVRVGLAKGLNVVCISLNSASVSPTCDSLYLLIPLGSSSWTVMVDDAFSPTFINQVAVGFVKTVEVFLCFSF